MVMRSEKPIGGVHPNARENGQISPSTNVRAAQNADSRPRLVSDLRESRKGMNIHLRMRRLSPTAYAIKY
jgi:hypothetical protein